MALGPTVGAGSDLRRGFLQEPNLQHESATFKACPQRPRRHAWRRTDVVVWEKEKGVEPVVSRPPKVGYMMPESSSSHNSPPSPDVNRQIITDSERPCTQKCHYLCLEV